MRVAVVECGEGSEGWVEWGWGRRGEGEGQHTPALAPRGMLSCTRCRRCPAPPPGCSRTRPGRRAPTRSCSRGQQQRPHCGKRAAKGGAQGQGGQGVARRRIRRRSKNSCTTAKTVGRLRELRVPLPPLGTPGTDSGTCKMTFMLQFTCARRELETTLPNARTNGESWSYCSGSLQLSVL